MNLDANVIQTRRLSDQFWENAAVWGPHYWFFLHTIAHAYPEHPNAVTKRKYYDLIQNMPIFIPDPEMGNKFSVILDKYPVTPYLDKRDSFIRWMHFIHNKINEKLEKPKISLSKFYEKYYEEYKPKDIKYKEYYKMLSKTIYVVIILGISLLIYYLYNK